MEAQNTTSGFAIEFFDKFHLPFPIHGFFGTFKAISSLVHITRMFSTILSKMYQVIFSPCYIQGFDFLLGVESIVFYLP
jgi:hypothetical protein